MNIPPVTILPLPTNLKSQIVIPPKNQKQTHFVPNKVAGGGGGSKAVTKVTIPPAYKMKSLFTSNVFYNKNTAISGVGSVTNKRKITNKT
jgi:hypothetical protein